jgi:hypothetical protein
MALPELAPNQGRGAPGPRPTLELIPLFKVPAGHPRAALYAISVKLAQFDSRPR